MTTLYISVFPEDGSFLYWLGLCACVFVFKVYQYYDSRHPQRRREMTPGAFESICVKTNDAMLENLKTQMTTPYPFVASKRAGEPLFGTPRA